MMKNKTIALSVLAALAAGSVTAPAMAGGVTYKSGDKYVKIGARIQMQYHQADPDGGDSTSELFFRRLRPYIEGSLHKNWKGKIQWDMGKAENTNEIAVKDAYFAYKGFKGMSVIIGNYSFPFSREFLTSSKYQQFVERTFTGDHNYGTPDRQMGVHLKGKAMGKKLTWGLALARGAVDPSDSKLDLDTVANKNSDFNEGFMVGGRVDFHPLGYMKMSQGDFKRDHKLTIGVAAYNWSNNEEIKPAGAEDVKDITAYEISAAYRGIGLSIDAEYNSFDASMLDAAYTGGLYKDGNTTLTNYMIKGGYMFGQSVEIVAGYQSQDADNYAKSWNRTSVGVNWFLHKHDIKFQLTYRMGENLKGKDGNDENETFVQAQYVF